MKQLGYYRLLFVALLGVAFYSPLNTLPFYIAVFWLAFELLNAQKLYTGQSYSRFSNLALLSLPIFVILVRNHWVPYYLEGIAVYNIMEHALFAFTFCLYLDCLLLCWQKIRVSGIGMLLLFNGIGIVNELFQNAVSGEPLTAFSAEDWKDIGVNGVGSILFYLIKQIMKSMKNID